MKHTPGPWTPVSETHHCIKTSKYFMMDGKRQYMHISSGACAVNHPSVQGAAERRANANLIAAAPDLLSALKCVLKLNPGAVYVDYQKPGWSESNPGAMYSEWDLAKEAIDKAEGRAK